MQCTPHPLQDELRDAVLLVFANKQDLPNAMNAAEITDKLGLHSLRQRHWCVHRGRGAASNLGKLELQGNCAFACWAVARDGSKVPTAALVPAPVPLQVHPEASMGTRHAWQRGRAMQPCGSCCGCG